MKKLLTFLFLIVFWIPAFSQHLLDDQWHYICIDSARGKWGDYGDPEWLRYFGLDMGDVDHDGDADILAGRYLYINPGGEMTRPWKRAELSRNADGIFITDVDGDENADIIAMAFPDVLWFEADGKDFSNWKSTVITHIAPTDHVNSQGFRKAQIIPGGKEELLIASAENVYCTQIPENPSRTPWKTTLIGENTSDEGIGTGDIDGDGDLDFAAGRRPEGRDEPTIMVWFENPGNIDGPWKNYEIGTSNHPIDRVRVADMDGDHKADIVMTEERWPGLEPDGNLFWFKNPGNPENKDWKRNRVVTQYSMNNLDVADIDHDGDQDIVTNEHKGTEHETQIWQNDGKGKFTRIVVDTGKENHLGTQFFDLDGDGDLDLIGAAWDNYKYMHVWRNDAINPDQVTWKHYSTVTGDLPVPNEGNEQTSSLVLDIDKDGINDFVITERTKAPAVVWYKFHNYKWDRHIIEAGPLFVEAGSAHYDIDHDGDEDIVFGGESRSNEVWWWENPYPDYSRPWVRRTIKASGGNKHHDCLFGDFDGDGREDLVFWCQGDHALYLAEIPDNPKTAKTWNLTVVYKYNDDSEMIQRGQENYPAWKGNHEHEGLTSADMDGDGVMDIVAGGRWFRYDGNGGYLENIIDAGYTFSRAAAGQLIEGGRPEVLLVVGDGVGPLVMYTYRRGTWFPRTLLKNVDNGHTLQVVDFNHDGHQDIFSAEMRFGKGNPDAKALLFLGDGKGNFQKNILVEGYGFHQSWLSDLDGDGDLDILEKPYSWEAPRLDIWINEGKTK